MSSDEFIPRRHLARVIEAVIDELDLTSLYASYGDEGRPAYHPKMLLTLLIYSYAVGIRSSRKIAQRLESDLVYLYLTGLQRPDFRTISDFRKRHVEVFKKLFTQTVMVCKQLGMVRVGHIAIDGTKIDACASSNERYSTERLRTLERQVEQRIEELINAAEATDQAEDETEKTDYPGASLPDELNDMKRLREKIKTARQVLEEQQLKNVNMTDHGSRVMKTGSGGWSDAYNAQIAVDSHEQVIVAADVVSNQNDKQQFIPMYEQVVENLGGLRPVEVSADAGYASKMVYEYIQAHGITVLMPDQQFRQEVKDGKEHLAPYDYRNFYRDPVTQTITCPAGSLMKKKGIEKHQGVNNVVYRGTTCTTCAYRRECITKANGMTRTITVSEVDTVIKEIRDVLMTKEGWCRYLKRLATVERVFGQLKRQLGYTYFLLCGLKNVKGEFHLMCLVHNIRKVAKKLGAKVGRAFRGIPLQLRPT